ncbi:MAG: hypothetical protein JSS27_16630 [Planctomycetes bacterium]|nr:hypothetical protein [Planctomycetota bacterium]
MANFFLRLAAIALTAFSWGVYGPLLRQGRDGVGGHLVQFICVGLAYFIIAVIVPLALLQTRGEKGTWTASGLIWSLAGGMAGAVGALGVILAFEAGGSPFYVMPLVFGTAPVVNTIVSMGMSKTFRDANPIFYAGIILVIAGASLVLLFNPAANPNAAAKSIFSLDQIKVLASIALTGLCWGAYGPVLHKGQAAMAGSRLRPLLCVGIAYFLVAVIVPVIMMSTGISHESFASDQPGFWPAIFWSLGGGAAGALGALGIILAFNYGGKPVVVMPVVFGCAPVVNTLTSTLASSTPVTLSTWFCAGLVVVVAGAVTVLVFAPKPKGGHGPAPTPAPSPSLAK